MDGDASLGCLMLIGFVMACVGGGMIFGWPATLFAAGLMVMVLYGTRAMM